MLFAMPLRLRIIKELLALANDKKMHRNMTTISDFQPIALLKQLVAIPSISRSEDDKAALLFDFLTGHGLSPKRCGNNIWCESKNFDPDKPTIMLNSHIDTVKPSEAWSTDPFVPIEKDGKIYALGANDAHASVVSLLAAFLNLSSKRQHYNLLLAFSCEEEVSGKGGMEALSKILPRIDLAVVGEPTGMNLAVAERGLMVLDCIAKGISGHAAREEGINAIYEALPDIEWFRTYEFEKKSEMLGKVKMSVTMVNAGRQHNVVPDKCDFVVDVRLNECYTHQQVLDIIRQHVKAEVRPRSMRLKPSGIDIDHPFVRRYIQMGVGNIFGSATMSDQALMPYTSVKIGPGDSARSHTADEYIRVSEIESAIDIYCNLLDGFDFSQVR